MQRLLAGHDHRVAPNRESAFRHFTFRRQTMATKLTAEEKRTARLEAQTEREATEFQMRILAERALVQVEADVEWKLPDGFGPQDPIARQVVRLRYTLASLLRDREQVVYKMRSLAEDLVKDAARLAESVGNADCMGAPLGNSYARDVVVEFTRLEMRVRDLKGDIHEAGFYAPELDSSYDRNRRAQRDQYVVSQTADGTWTLLCDGRPIEAVSRPGVVSFPTEWRAWFAFKSLDLR
jgi:hypothetical protein